MSLSPEEIQLAKVGIQEALKPFAGLMHTLFGGTANEISGMLQDSFRARKMRRLIPILKQLGEQFRDSGIKPSQIPDNI